MAVHWLDVERQENPARPPGKMFRLFGLLSNGTPYFYWSATKGEFAAYYPKNRRRTATWGTLGCGSGKRMKPENRVFLADLATAMALERAGLVRPCRNCNKRS